MFPAFPRLCNPGGQDQEEDQPGCSEGQPDGSPGQAGHGGGGERHGRMEEELAEGRGAKDEILGAVDKICILSFVNLES